VVILVWITARYAESTAKILDESKKARAAAERQVAAAQESVHLLERQLAEQLGLGRSIIQSAIQSLTQQIEYWRAQDIKSLAPAGGLPPTDDLIPQNLHAAVEHARRISPVAAEELLRASDEIKIARNEIESVRTVSAVAGHGQGIYDAAATEVRTRLMNAFTLLTDVQRRLL
jgi:hypothetical protein